MPTKSPKYIQMDNQHTCIRIDRVSYQQQLQHC